MYANGPLVRRQIEPEGVREHLSRLAHRPRAEGPRLVPLGREAEQGERVAAAEGARHEVVHPLFYPPLLVLLLVLLLLLLLLVLLVLWAGLLPRRGARDDLELGVRGGVGGGYAELRGGGGGVLKQAAPEAPRVEPGPHPPPRGTR